MSFLKTIMSTDDDLLFTLARLVLGAVYFVHGSQKLLGWFDGPGFSATMGGFTHQGIPAPLALLAIFAEFFGGLGLMVGLLGRIAAFGIAVDMLVAVVLVHSHFGFFMNWTGRQPGEGYEFHLLAIALALVIAVKGSGALSLDRVLSRSRHRSVRLRIAA